MKHFPFYFIISILLSFMITGCARWGGDNPVGITGGSEQGYGQNNNLNLPDTSIQKTIDPELQGSWIYLNSDSWIAITFYANGAFNIREISDATIHEEIYVTYFISGNTITLIINGKSETNAYSIIADQLLITIDGKKMLFDREQIIK
jgi:hypothetical protein